MLPATIDNPVGSASPPAHSQQQPPLHWVAGCYYRLRNPHFAAQITTILPGSLRGTVFPLSKLKFQNGEPFIEPKDLPGNHLRLTEEWDFDGNAQGPAQHDLMDLVR